MTGVAPTVGNGQPPASASDRPKGAPSDAPFSELALDYFAKHAIDPALAAELGVTERGGSLIYACIDEKGPFERSRKLSDNPEKKTMQPKRPLVCWWPGGRPEQAARVLVCEGEPDALAALSAIARADSLPEAPKELLRDLSVVALPGASFPAERLVEELRQVDARHVVLAPDADPAGDRCREKAVPTLAAADIKTLLLSLPGGADLADCLAAADDPAEWLAAAIADVQAQAQEQQASSPSEREAEEPWRPLPGAPPPFPLEALPTDMRRWVKAIAEETQTPPDLAALMGLGTLSAGALGRAVVNCGWLEELALYLIVALPPGERKSQVMREAREPLRGIERELQELSAPQRREQAQRREILEGQKDKLRKAAIGQTDPEARKLTEGELTQIGTELDELDELVKPRLLCDDVTPEGIAKLLAAHERIAVIAAESALIDNLLGKYDGGGNPNLHLVCQAYAGEATWIDRTSGDPKALERPLLAITLAPQPHVLERMISHPIARAQGFAGRFAFSLPRSNLGSRDVDAKSASSEVRAAWAAIIRHVCPPQSGDRSDRTTGTVDSCPSSVTSVTHSLEGGSNNIISLSPDARALFRAFRVEMESRLTLDGDLRPFGEYVTKHEGRVARIAGLLHLVEYEIEAPISATTMRGALQIGEYLLAHTMIALKVGDEITRRQFQWLEAREQSTVSQREIHRGLLRDGKPSEVEELIAKLVLMDVLRPVRVTHTARQGRPPGPIYEINENLRKDLPADGPGGLGFEQPGGEQSSCSPPSDVGGML